MMNDEKIALYQEMYNLHVEYVEFLDEERKRAHQDFIKIYDKLSKEIDNKNNCLATLTMLRSECLRQSQAKK